MRYYLHETPGRLRIKIPSLRGNHREVRLVKDELMGLAGVKEVTENVITGSIVIIRDPNAVKTRDALSVLKNLGYIDEKRGYSASIENDAALSKAGFVLGKAIFGMAVEKALAPTGLSFLAALL